MSYVAMGLGAPPSLALQWKDQGGGLQSAAVNPKGPVCGYQIAAQVMLGDLGFGAGKGNGNDAGFPDAFHQFATAKGIAHTAGTPANDTMCGALMDAWMAIAAPTAGNKNLWAKTASAPPPAPGATTTSQLKLPAAAAADGSWWSRQTPGTKKLLIAGGAGALLLAVLVNLPKKGT